MKERTIFILNVYDICENNKRETISYLLQQIINDKKLTGQYIYFTSHDICLEDLNKFINLLKEYFEINDKEGFIFKVLCVQ